MNIKIKLKIIYQKLLNNWNDELVSPEIKSFQENSKFIKLLRLEFKKMKDSESFQSQMNKNILRSISRYSEDLINLANIVFNEISKKLIKSRNYSPTYFMRPYLMIHLPNDRSEEGIMHSDYEYTKDGFVTCWIPLENYEYPPLSSIGKVGQIISSFPKTQNFLKFFKEINISNFAKPGDAKFWSQSYLHKGNLNCSNNTSFVLVTKLSRQELLGGSYAVKNNKFNINLFKKDIIPFKSNIYEELKLKIYDLIDKLNGLILINNYSDLLSISISFTKNNDKDFLKITSFFFSLMAQRIWARPFFFEKLNDINIEDGNKLWKLMDITSIILGCENVSSIQRLSSSNFSIIPSKVIRFINDEIILDSKEYIKKEWIKIYDKSKSYN